MDQKLTPISFTNIFRDSLPNLLTPIPAKSFQYCIKNYDLPYLSHAEKECVRLYTLKYLYSMDYILLNFSKKLI